MSFSQCSDLTWLSDEMGQTRPRRRLLGAAVAAPKPAAKSTGQGG